MAKWTKEEMRIIKVYKGMKERCYNPNNIGYRRYGARGLEVKFTKEEFIDWYHENVGDIIKPHAARIDKNSHYDLENMHIISSRRNGQDTVDHFPNWDTRNENMRKANKAREINVTIDGIKHDSVRCAAKYLACDQRTIRRAIKKYGKEMNSYKETRTKFSVADESHVLLKKMGSYIHYINIYETKELATDACEDISRRGGKYYIVMTIKEWKGIQAKSTRDSNNV